MRRQIKEARWGIKKGDNYKRSPSGFGVRELVRTL